MVLSFWQDSLLDDISKLPLELQMLVEGLHFNAVVESILIQR